MSMRIRYSVTEDGGKISNRVIQTNTGEVLVKYYTDGTIVILNPGSYNTIERFQCPTPKLVQKAIKNKLISMGAVFAEEKRERQGKDEVIT